MTDEPTGTGASILDAAERMAQAVGYNGLSFRDVAAAVGISSASVHYHFPSKGQLGAAIARRYTDRLANYLDAVDASGAELTDALAAYVSVFRTTLERDGRMCLCGILAAETDAIPDEVRAEVRRFVDVNVRWVSGVLDRATQERATGPATGGAGREHARAMFAALEGAMLVARGTGEIASFDAITAQFRRTGLIPG